MPNLNPSDFPDTVFSTGTRIELQKLGIYDASAYIEQGGLVQDAIDDCPEGGMVLLRRRTYDCPAGLTMTNKPVYIVGQGTQSILQTNQAVTLLNVNAATTSMVGWGLRNLQLRGLNVGTVGIGVNRSAAWEHTQFNLTDVLVNGFQIGLDIESPAKGLAINSAFEFGFGTSTGVKVRGASLMLLSCWTEQVATGYDLYGAAEVVNLFPKTAANVTTKVVTLSESGFEPRYQEFGNYQPVALTYGTTVNVDATAGTFRRLVVTNGTGFTIASPTNVAPGQTITFEIVNSSGGAMGTVTWGAAYLTAGWVNPASTKRKTISFYYNGTAGDQKWVQVGPPSADL